MSLSLARSDSSAGGPSNKPSNSDLYRAAFRRSRSTEAHARAQSQMTPSASSTNRAPQILHWAQLHQSSDAAPTSSRQPWAWPFRCPSHGKTCIESTLRMWAPICCARFSAKCRLSRGGRSENDQNARRNCHAGIHCQKLQEDEINAFSRHFTTFVIIATSARTSLPGIWHGL